MAQQNQDFITYSGDNPAPIFTVLSSSTGATQNISGISQITWSVQRNATDGVIVSKTYTAGQISFPNSGTDGRFQVQISSTDTSAMSGWYQHFASITDASNNVTTVEVGRMQVGLQPSWTWDPGSVGVESLYTVRQLIGDTIQSDQQLQDQQILWAIGEYSNEWLAAAECCRNIAAYYSRLVDTVEGTLRTLYSSRTKRYQSLAADLEQRGFARGGTTVYAGGISITDKQNVVANTDRVPPNFVIAMYDNLLPEGPVGIQTNSNLSAPNDASVDNYG